jgi:hypothetical protein
MFAVAVGIIAAPLAGMAIQTGLTKLLDFDER